MITYVGGFTDNEFMVYKSCVNVTDACGAMNDFTFCYNHK